MKSFNDGKFFMPENPLWDEIETPNGETNAKYTIKVSLLNEQEGNKEWGGKKVAFCNEDNAISHLGLLERFFELLCENKDWGYEWASKEVVNNILNPIKALLEGEKLRRKIDG